MASRSAASAPVSGRWILTVIPPVRMPDDRSSPDSSDRGDGKVAGHLAAGRGVEPDVGGAQILGEVGAGAGPRDEQDVRDARASHSVRTSRDRWSARLK